LELEQEQTYVSQREVLLSAALYRFSAQMASMARELDELQEIARAGRQSVVLTCPEGNVVHLERKR
jgi:hypothetical protein